MIGFRCFVRRIAKFSAPKLLAFCVLAFAGGGAEVSHAQVSDAEKTGYADALTYCQRDVTRPMALRSDKRVLCLDGRILGVSDIWLSGSLEHGGIFVVRGHGGDIALTIALADMLLAKEATVVVSDYCFGICADYLFIASTKAFVPKGALVAWTNHATGPDNCIGFSTTSDATAPRLDSTPCAGPFVHDSSAEKLRELKGRFYFGRVSAPPFREPPESVAVRRVLKRKFDATGKFPENVYWTWNPRFYAGVIRTKVLYEAYPQNQDDVDAIVARIGLPNPVIHDP